MFGIYVSAMFIKFFNKKTYIWYNWMSEGFLRISITIQLSRNYLFDFIEAINYTTRYHDNFFIMIVIIIITN